MQSQRKGEGEKNAKKGIHLIQRQRSKLKNELGRDKVSQNELCIRHNQSTTQEGCREINELVGSLVHGCFFARLATRLEWPTPSHPPIPVEGHK